MEEVNDKKTLLSIIVPTYNCEAYLEEGLDSILSGARIRFEEGMSFG